MATRAGPDDDKVQLTFSAPLDAVLFWAQLPTGLL